MWRFTLLRGMAALVILASAGTWMPCVHAAGEVPADWLSRAQKDIAAREYHVTWQEKTCIDGLGAAWHATNRAQNVRTYFTPEGPVTVSRTDPQAGWRTGVALTRAGWKGAPTPVEPARLDAKDNTITYARGAALTEWYVNDEKGLKSWYRFEKAPAGGPPAAAELELRMDVTGNAKAVLLPDGSGVKFTGPSGAAVLRYGKLLTVDAAGRELPCRYELCNDERGQVLSIVVDAAGARYPVSVDPLASSHSSLLAGDQADCGFGYSASTAGDVNGDGYADIIVGAPSYDNGQNSEGKAFVYHGSASGLGSTPNWTFESDQGLASAGYTVGTAGDVNGDGYSDVTLTAPFFTAAQSMGGRVYVCHGSAAGLTPPVWWIDGDVAGGNLGQQGSFTAGDVNGDGYSDLIMSSADYDNDPDSHTGEVRVYHGSAAGLSVAPNWVQTRPSSATTFGAAASTVGDVNGDGYSDVAVTDSAQSIVYVYHGSAAGLPSNHNWAAAIPSNNSLMGLAAVTAGDVNGDGYADMLVAVPDFDSHGVVRVYHGSASGLITPAAVILSHDVSGETFGYSVSTAGDINGDGYADVIVGTPIRSNGEVLEGYACAYLGSPAGLASTPCWEAESNQASSRFGACVAAAGDVNGDGYADVLVGAHNYDAAVTNAGAVFLYSGYNGGLAASANWTLELDQSAANLGFSVACAGDVNGDGYSDVIVGAPNYDSGQIDEGIAVVYKGTANGLLPAWLWIAESDQASASFGYSVNTAGDVNGDGYSDIIVGAPGWDNGSANEGGAFVWFGSADAASLGPEGTIAGADWYAEGNAALRMIGYAVSTAGDVNGDGYADILVGSFSGYAYAWHGSFSGLGATGNPSTNADWTAALASSSYFGSALSTAGDVNGDGYSDVIVGAYGYTASASAEGVAVCYHGGASGLSTTANWTRYGGASNVYFGAAVSTAGDVNRDGYSDVIVGAPQFSNGNTNEGLARVYHGGASGLGDHSWEQEGNSSSVQMGASVCTAGDVNRDGYSDVIVGTPYYGSGIAGQGRATVYYGSAAGVTSTWAQSMTGNQAAAHLGNCVSTAGDINGDGFSDIVVGATGYDNGQTDEGAVFVWYGGIAEGSCATMLPRQRSADDYGPIVPPLRTNSSEHVRLGLLGRTPASRGKVKMQVEFKPVGQAFDGAGLVESPSWISTAGARPLDLMQAFWGLTPSTCYQWRARVRYQPGTCFFQQYGPWFHLPKHPAAHSFRTRANLGTVKYYDRDFPADDTDPVGGQAGGWAKFGPSAGNPATTELGYDGTHGAYRVRVMTASASKYKLAGWAGNRSEWLPCKSVGSQSYVRGKFYIYAQNDPTTPWSAYPADLPSFEMRVANRYAVTSQLFVKAGSDASRDLRPSTDPTNPSVYRVDFDPVDVPFLATSTTNEGIMPAFEVFEPTNNMARGSVAMTELALFHYPASALGVALQQKIYDGTKNSQAGDLHLFVPSDQQTANFVPGAGMDDAATLEYTNLPTYTESTNGVTVLSAAVPSNRVGRISNDFHAGSDGLSVYTTRIRVQQNFMYKARFHITSTRNTNLQSSLWLKMRSVGSGYVNYLQLGPGTATGNNGAILRQALPGAGSLNPDAGWYTLLLYTPLSLDMRPDMAGTIAQRMPNLTAEPGPGVDAPSKRDVKVGFDFWDSISGNGAEVGHFVFDRVEVTVHNVVTDN